MCTVLRRTSSSLSSLVSSIVLRLTEGLCPRHAVSELACLALSSARSCRSDIYPGRLSTALLVSLVVFYCRTVSKWWHVRSIARLASSFILTLLIMSLTRVLSLSDPDMGPPVLVCNVEHTSFHIGLCGSVLVMCLFGERSGLCTIRYRWQNTWVAHAIVLLLNMFPSVAVNSFCEMLLSWPWFAHSVCVDMLSPSCPYNVV